MLALSGRLSSRSAAPGRVNRKRPPCLVSIHRPGNGCFESLPFGRIRAEAGWLLKRRAWRQTYSAAAKRPNASHYAKRRAIPIESFLTGKAPDVIHWAVDPRVFDLSLAQQALGDSPVDAALIRNLARQARKPLERARTEVRGHSSGAGSPNSRPQAETGERDPILENTQAVVAIDELVERMSDRRIQTLGMQRMYFVHATEAGSKPIEFRYGSLTAALSQACALIEGGAADVSIHDADGNRVEGAELAACCRGERSLPSNLRSH